MLFSWNSLRVAAVIGAASFALGAMTFPAHAQTMRQQMADKIAVNAAHQFVTKIQGESCSQFASTMQQMKSSKSGSSGMSSKLKANSQARSDFVNIMAGPLLNKMIDCDMMPGGM